MFWLSFLLKKPPRHLLVMPCTCRQICFLRIRGHKLVRAFSHHQVFCEAQRTSPSVLYLPDVQRWWEMAGPSLRLCFSSLLLTIPSFCPVLLLATCSAPYRKLDPQVWSRMLLSVSLDFSFSLT